MFNTLGERITYCRNLLGFAKNEMAEKISDNISLPTLARWELNTVAPSSKKIEFLANFFISQGINVTKEWLKEGFGYPPISIDLKKFDISQFDELAYTSLVDIRNKVKDFYFSQANSNFCRPILSFGDYLGGIIEPNKKLLEKKLCFLFTDSIATAGIYNYEKNAISSLYGEIKEIHQDLSESVKIGEVQWIIRRP